MLTPSKPRFPLPKRPTEVGTAGGLVPRLCVPVPLGTAGGRPAARRAELSWQDLCAPAIRCYLLIGSSTAGSGRGKEIANSGQEEKQQPMGFLSLSLLPIPSSVAAQHHLLPAPSLSSAGAVPSARALLAARCSVTAVFTHTGQPYFPLV